MGGKERLIQSLIAEGYLKTPAIIEAFRAIDRADFVRPEYQDEAYGNYPLPIGSGQTISQPLTVAFMFELLEPQPGENILDIGSGSGWTTALLAHIVGTQGRVVALERIEELCELGRKNIEKYSFLTKGVAALQCLDASAEIPGGTYDKIIAAAAAGGKVPDAWREKVKIGGRIVAPVDGSVWLFIKTAENEWTWEEFPGFAFVPLLPGTSGSSGERRIQKGAVLPKKKKCAFCNWTFFGVCVVLFLGALILLWAMYTPYAAYSGVKNIEIAPGTGSRQIADILKKEGVVRSKWAFEFYISFRGKASLLKPGSYLFGRAAIPEVVRDLIRGGTNERLIIIPEGWSGKDIASYLEDEGVAGHETFFDRIGAKGSKEFVARFDFLKDKPEKAGLEGYLFPDTYRIYRDAKVDDIIAKMLENFGKKLTPDLREEIARQKKTVFEMATIASLIEEEVAGDEDRAIVSGILWKRLEAGIPLQVDATISYITGKKGTKISRGETQIGSPYNTYKYRGLPAGPIANPGLSAIRAAIYPKDSPHLYYLSTPNGQTIFSKTLEEHNEAKAQYLKK